MAPTIRESFPAAIVDTPVPTGSRATPSVPEVMSAPEWVWAVLAFPEATWSVYARSP
ncbi:hypothetical protein OG589_40475 [Sphaerisporangium sp. NBC_01403]|uniref:hypothetical protein n=1 Tax=Sphaerisporangium sp. NBC_01403 TaxID=2903599 RepID=UPI0032560701